MWCSGARQILPRRSLRKKTEMVRGRKDEERQVRPGTLCTNCEKFGFYFNDDGKPLWSLYGGRE